MSFAPSYYFWSILVFCGGVKMTDSILKFENITKKFGGVVALNDVSFSVKKGFVTGLVGENGAGKSTLIKICGGVHQPTSGKIYFEGEDIEIKNPRHAEKIGISVVHQELPICKNLNVMENIFLGPDLPGEGLFPDKKYMVKRTKELFERLEVDIAPDKPVEKCSIGEQQTVMIAKAINKNAEIILMDEPTSALSPKEVDSLYNIIENLRNEGVSILFISHRLEEVLKISDEISVLKDGEFVGKVNKNEATEDKLVNMMVGRDVRIMDRSEREEVSEESILEVRGLTNEKLGIKDISFELKKGEILGLAGLRGAGRSELAQVIIGYQKMEDGEIFLEGERLNINSPSEAIENGIGYLTEERGSLGLFFNFDIKSNVSLLKLADLSKAGIVNENDMTDLALEQGEKLNIVMSSVDQMISELSGGNQQKVLLARWLAASPKVLILDEPTRGIDVGVKEEIRELIVELSRQNYSIILISSEMLEIMNISDRMLVFSEGELSGKFNREEATEEKIMNAAVENL